MEVHFYLQFLIKKIWRPIIPVFTATLLAVFLLFQLRVLPDGNLHLKFYKEADSVFIKTPSGARLFVDRGDGFRLVNRLFWQLPFFAKSFDLIVLDGQGSDRSLAAIRSRFKVKSVVLTGGFDELTRDSNGVEPHFFYGKSDLTALTEVYSLRNGDQIRIGEVRIKNLPTSGSAEAVNQPEFTPLLLSYRNLGLLLLRTRSANEVDGVIGRQTGYKIDFLALTQNGPGISLSREILASLEPKGVFLRLQKGKKYGETLSLVSSLLSESKVKLLTPEKDGDVEIVSDGQKYWLKH